MMNKNLIDEYLFFEFLNIFFFHWWTFFEFNELKSVLKFKNKIHKKWKVKVKNYVSKKIMIQKKCSQFKKNHEFGKICLLYENKKKETEKCMNFKKITANWENKNKNEKTKKETKTVT